MPLFHGSDEELLWINAEHNSGKIDTRKALRYMAEWCRSRHRHLVANIEDAAFRKKRENQLASIAAHIV